MGCFKQILSNPIVSVVADAVATATGNPELIPVINAGLSTAGNLANGQSLGKSLGQGAIAGGTSFAGQELVGAVANQFPETFAGAPGGTGGNSLTDLFGTTQGAGSLTGPGTIGGDISNGFDNLSNWSPTSGLSSLFGGTPQNAGTFTSDFNAINNGSSAGADTALAAGAVPGNTNVASNFLPAGSVSNAAGGGASGGGFDLSAAANPSALPSSTGTGGASDLFAQGLANPDASTDVGSNVGFNIPGISATGPALSTGGSSVGPAPSLFSSASPLLNGILRAGATYLGTDTNQKGYKDLQNAAGQAGANYQPFVNSGTAANKTLADLFGTNGQPAQASAQGLWENTPGYQFAMNQGINAVNANAARMGQVLSGNNQQAVQQYGTGLANQTFNQYVKNLQDQAGAGLSAAGGLGTAQLAGGNAAAQGSGANAAKNNQFVGTLADTLFPSSNILDLILKGQNGNQGLAGLFA